jgi:hypothetical protein
MLIIIMHIILKGKFSIGLKDTMMQLTFETYDACPWFITRPNLSGKAYYGKGLDRALQIIDKVLLKIRTTVRQTE